jgi:hypothetical protein
MKKLAIVVLYLISLGIAAEIAARVAARNQLAGFRVALAEMTVQRSLRTRHTGVKKLSSGC